MNGDKVQGNYFKFISFETGRVDGDHSFNAYICTFLDRALLIGRKVEFHDGFSLTTAKIF